LDYRTEPPVPATEPPVPATEPPVPAINLQSFTIYIRNYLYSKQIIEKNVFFYRLFLLRTALEMKTITKVVFLKRLADLRPLLIESQTILAWEPEGSIENSR
jgi:hypothetical protein